MPQAFGAKSLKYEWNIHWQYWAYFILYTTTSSRIRKTEEIFPLSSLPPPTEVRWDGVCGRRASTTGCIQHHSFKPSMTEPQWPENQTILPSKYNGNWETIWLQLNRRGHNGEINHIFHQAKKPVFCLFVCLFLQWLSHISMVPRYQC